MSPDLEDRLWMITSASSGSGGALPLPFGDGGDAAGSFGTRRQVLDGEETRRDRSWACASFNALVHDSCRLYETDLTGYYAQQARWRSLTGGHRSSCCDVVQVQSLCVTACVSPGT
jgi:hypothetical protein